MSEVIHIKMPIADFESLLWILAEWGNCPATKREAVTPEQFTRLVETLEKCEITQKTKELIEA